MNSPIKYLLLFVICLSSCGEKSTQKQEQSVAEARFTLLNSNETGVSFSNTMVEDETVKLTFEHRFNGGGVAIGDVNNDGLQDLFFTATNLDNKLYLNQGGFKFKDITESAGFQPVNGVSSGVNMVDINCDGFLDIYVCRTGKFDLDDRSNLLYINNGDLTFTESAREYGLNDTGYSNQSTFFDYDNDGDLDMYLVNQPIKYTYANTVLLQNDTVREFVSDRLFRNNGDNTFTDITAQAGILNKAFGFNAAIEDFNGDGYWDIYVTNDYLQPDYLYINNKNGTFSDSLSRYMKHCPNSSMGSVIADYNNDGLSDVFVLDMMAEDNHRQKLLRGPMDFDDFDLSSKNGAYYQYMRNQLQLNNGNGTFSEIGHIAGVSHTDWSWGPLMADFDNDGWKDLFVANGYRRDLTNMDYVTYFLDSINKIGGMGIFKTMSEMFNSLPETPVQNYAFRNKGDLTFENVSDKWGFREKTFSNGASYADLDNDGDLDIVINNVDSKAMIYRNETAGEDESGSIIVKLIGDSCNSQGIGTQLTLFDKGTIQKVSYFSTQGFFSSIPNQIHFGVGNSPVIDSLLILWPGNFYEVIYNIKKGATVIADRSKAIPYSAPESRTSDLLFTDVTSRSGLNFTYQENEFIDFKREPLIPMNYSNSGPCMAKGDINNDGLEDVFIGGAKGFSGVIYLQNSNGTFRKLNSSTLENDRNHEDGGALFFDYNNDGKLDLYVSSGGNEWDPMHEYYQDRLYINTGNGNFKKAAPGVLPEIKFSTTCPAAADIDGDGDQDLFVGGRIVSWNYPLSPRSFVLINENGKYIDATQQVAPQLYKPGLVCDAHWADINNDDEPDLIVAGQWMSPSFYLNQNGTLNKVIDSTLEKNSGWWNCIESADFDNDGDLDFVFGNRGLNSRITANYDEPARVYAKDFDKNGTLDAIGTYYIQGKSYPIPLRDQLTDQIRPLKKKYLRYHQYADATIYDIFPREEVESAYILTATNFASCYVENLGNGQFKVTRLPFEAQYSSIQKIIADDFNNDGNLDILFAGNDYRIEVETGRYDASIGGLLLGDGNGNFKTLKVIDHGFFAPGDVRAMEYLNKGKKNFIVIGRNSEPAMVVEVHKSSIPL